VKRFHDIRRAPCLSAVICACVALVLCGHAPAAQWAVSVDQREGLPLISKGGANGLTSAFAFWGADWSWARHAVDFRVVAPFEYALAGTNAALDLEMQGRVARPADRQLVWTLDFRGRTTQSGVIGGGITFRFDLEAFGPELGEPDLLPERRGWVWGKAGGERFEMRFDPPLEALYFERGRKSEIRALFYKDRVAQGARRQVATLTASGPAAIAPSAPERFGLDDPQAWPADILDWSRSPVDLAFLNAAERPAGRRGFVRVDQGRLVFADGTPARFWGTNLSALALFATKPENVRQQARRLSALGFNLVRIHHHDSIWVDPNIFGSRAGSTAGVPDPAMLEKLDWWLKCLMDEGIYVWLDLHVGRQLRAGDGIEAFEEIAKGAASAELKGYNYVNASIQRAMRRFNEAYVNRINAFTGRRYADEPGIAAMLLTNENDLTQHFGNLLLPDKKVPQHTAWYMAQAQAFADRHRLPRDRVWRAWEHGPSKLFLNDLEHRFASDQIEHLRALGVKAPIATTSTWGGNALSALPALSAGSVIDAHAYGGLGELTRNPIHGPNLAHWLAAAQVAGMPLAVSEWNVEPFPAADRHAIPLYMAATGRFQGWDALLQYAYAQIPLNGAGSASSWHTFNDPAAMAMLPAAALLYRQGHVREAKNTYVFAPDKEQLFGAPISPANSVALRTAAERSRLVIALPSTPELPWLSAGAPQGTAVRLTDASRPLIPLDATQAVSDTGELRRDWGEGLYVVTTPRTQAVTGWIGGKPIRLPDVEVAIRTRNASVAVQSLDAQPIALADRLLISVGARAVPARGDRLPFLAEPVLGELRVRARKGLSLYRAAGPGEVLQRVASAYRDGRYTIPLEAGLRTYWLVLQ
jgi:hypothetical protein